MATDQVGPVLTAMLGAASAALSPPAGRAALYPGAELAWDDCCDGQVWVRLIQLLPSPLPGTPGVSQPCGVMNWTAVIGVGALRCAAVLNDQGMAPSPAQLSADTLQMTADQAALIEAIQCQMSAWVQKMTILRWDPLGPSGECVGGEWVFTALIPNCPCP